MIGRIFEISARFGRRVRRGGRFSTQMLRLAFGFLPDLASSLRLSPTVPPTFTNRRLIRTDRIVQLYLLESGESGVE
jgi:hypothetical protein